MMACVVEGCRRPATRGEVWTEEPLGPIEQYRKGIRLEFAVKDLAVRLELCDEHARELTAAAWEAALGKLNGWGWRPLRRAQG